MLALRYDKRHGKKMLSNALGGFYVTFVALVEEVGKILYNVFLTEHRPAKSP